MALTLPNLQSSPTFDGQTIDDATDLAALSAQAGGQGVYVGCGVTPHTGSDMNVTVAAGAVVINGAIVSVSAVSSLAVGAASSYDRRDIVTVNSSGTVSVTAGTPCGTAGWTRSTNALGPVKPAIPSNSVLLAEVYVASTTTAIASGNILDKTCPVLPDVLAEVQYVQSSNYTIASTTMAAVDSTNLRLTCIVPPSGKVRVRADMLVGVSATAYYAALVWFEHGTTTVQPGCYLITFRPDSTAAVLPTNWEWLITGLTPGSTLDIDLAWGSSSSLGTVTIYPNAAVTKTIPSADSAPVHLMALAA